MAYDLEEQESIDQMKAWWEQWGTPITAAVCAVCIGFAGWNGWNWYQRNQAAKAAGAYVQLQSAVANADMKNIESISAGLMSEYGSTVYGALGALSSATAQAQNGNIDGAVLRLRWVIDESGSPEYTTLARVRLAGLMLEKGEIDEALTVIDQAKPTSFQVAMVEDRRGDILFAKKDYEKARESWMKVLEAEATGSVISQVVKLKIGSLPTE